MRNVFLLLLLVNLGVLAFFSWIAERPEPAEPYAGPGLVLLREADPELLAAAMTNETPAAGACVSIGPFAEAAEAESAMATLSDAGFDSSPATREAEVWDGYWVYIERIESIESARAIETELAENGIDDTLVIPNSDSGILLSLGVFSDIARAGNRAEAVDELGFRATITDSMTTTETFWLDVALTDGESIALELLETPGTISRLEQLACGDA